MPFLTVPVTDPLLITECPLTCKPLRLEVLGDDVETVFARMFLCVAVVVLISACTGYNESASRDHRSQGGFYGGEAAYQRTGQPSVLPGWTPRYY